MSGVLTEQSTVDCGHGGTVATTGNGLLTVNGKPVLTKQGVQGKSVSASCGTIPATNPTSAKCLTVTAVEKTEATTLLVGGVAVLIDPLGGATDGVRAGSPAIELKATVVQTRLRAD
jgi:hypothetical protein